MIYWYVYEEFCCIVQGRSRGEENAVRIDGKRYR